MPLIIFICFKDDIVMLICLVTFLFNIKGENSLNFFFLIKNLLYIMTRYIISHKLIIYFYNFEIIN